MNRAPSNGAHSAEVKMRLIINGIPIRITHMGPDFLLIEPTSERPPCDATIYFRVDSDESEWRVRLPNGISKDSNRVELAVCK
jgi:hypothetical protein